MDTFGSSLYGVVGDVWFIRIFFLEEGLPVAETVLFNAELEVL